MAATTDANPAPAPPEVVLVVDDSSVARRLVTDCVRSQAPDLAIVEAENGQEALVRLNELRQQQREPRFIVCDLEMPVMDGWDFLTKLKEEYERAGKVQGIPVIVLSSSSGERGRFFFKKSVHNDQLGYTPLVALAKDTCLKPEKYLGKGEVSLRMWIKHMLALGRRKA